VHQDAFDLARNSPHGLVDEIEVHFFGLCTCPSVEHHLSCPSNERESGAIDAVEEFQEPLAFELGQGFADGFADKLFGASAAGYS
jgi:hypothetical protein